MKLLIGYDGSDCANATLDDLDRAGLPEVAEVVILCVADVFLPPDSGAKEEAAPMWLTARINQARAHMIKAVEEARATAERARGRVKSEHAGWRIHAEACADSPGWGIIKRACEWRADLVIVGAHGHSETLGLFLGSISQRVLHDSPCSVRVGRTPKSKRRSPVRVIVGADGSRDSEMALRHVANRLWPAEAPYEFSQRLTRCWHRHSLMGQVPLRRKEKQGILKHQSTRSMKPRRRSCERLG
jgi:nucleotide-binding universal stress UspA family protein